MKEGEHYEFQKFVNKINMVEYIADTTEGMHEFTKQLGMTVYVKTIEGKTIRIRCNNRQKAVKIKDKVERRTATPKKHHCLVSQGKAMKDDKTIDDCSIKKGTTIEMTLRLQGGTNDHEMKTSAGTTEERQVKRRTSEPISEISGIEEVKLGDVADLIRREVESASQRSEEGIENASKRSDDRMEKVIKTLQTETMEQMEVMIRRSNEMLSQQVSVQLQGMGAAMERMKEDGEDKYDNINEKISTVETRLTKLEETGSRRNVLTQISIEEYQRAQEDLNQRRAAATGFHDDTKEQEVEELLKNSNCNWNVDGENSDQVSGETDHTRISSIQ